MSDVVVTAPAAPLPAGVYQSKWGLHPCSYETFKKLCFLNVVYLKALRADGTLQRWQRKQPQNRVTRLRLRNPAGQVIGYSVGVPIPEPRVCPFSLFDVPHVARLARTPQATPAAVTVLPVSVAEIDALVAEAETWTGRKWQPPQPKVPKAATE